jgi:hypothetical protein
MRSLLLSLAASTALLALLVLAPACSEPASTPADAAPPNDQATLDASLADSGPADADAAKPRVVSISLVVTGQGTTVDRLYAPVRYKGKDALLMFDTGAAMSFLHMGIKAAPYTPKAGSVEIGGYTLELAGRNFDPSTHDGKQVVGTLGADFLLLGVGDLDLKCGKLTVYLNGAPSPGATWPTVAFDDVKGHVITPVKLDGQALRLMLDTGAQHTLWLGQQGKPGDQTVQTTDAVGNVLTLYLGSASLVLGSDPVKQVSVLRAPSFPYLEQTVKILGGNIHGLLGLSALVGRSIVFDGAALKLRLEPPGPHACK